MTPCHGMCKIVWRSYLRNSALMLALLAATTLTAGCMTALGDLFAPRIQSEAGTWEGTLDQVRVVDHNGELYSAVRLRVTGGQVDVKAPHASVYLGTPEHPRNVLVVGSDHRALSARGYPLLGKKVRVSGTVGLYDNPILEGVGQRIGLESNSTNQELQIIAQSIMALPD